MKTFLKLVVIALIAPQAAPQNSGYPVRGVLTRDGTAEPIAGAQITLQAASPSLTEAVANRAALQRGNTPRPAPLVLSATTDEGGRFQFKDVPSGRYGLRAQKTGFVNVPPGLATGVVVDSLSSTKEVQAALIRTVSLTGHVRDSDGKPIPLATVEVMNRTFNGPDRGLLTAGQAVSDDRGEYRVFGLRPDDNYYVVVDMPAKLTMQALRAQARGERTPNNKLVQIYYPDVLDPEKAVPVDLTSNSESTTLELIVHIPKTFAISGRAIAPQGTAVPGSAPPSPAFFLQRRGLWTTSLPVPNRAADTTGGKFELQDVPPGSYDLFVSTRTPPNPIMGRTAVEITDHDVKDIEVVIKQGNNVAIRAVSTEPGFIVPAAASIRLMPSEIPTAVMNGMNRGTPADSSGTFTIVNVPDGRYDTRISGFPPDTYIRDIRQGATSISNSDLVIAGSQAQPIQLELARGTGSIHGVTIDAKGNPVGARVTLTPPIALQQVGRLYRPSTMGIFGEFLIDSIAPGEYRLFAFDGRNPENIRDSAVRNKYESRGTRVVVTSGGTATVQLPVISKPAQ